MNVFDQFENQVRQKKNEKVNNSKPVIVCESVSNSSPLVTIAK